VENCKGDHAEQHDSRTDHGRCYDLLGFLSDLSLLQTQHCDHVALIGLGLAELSEGFVVFLIEVGNQACTIKK
jgi:hypothetical protein